jgi:hypothetical protein
MRSTPKELIRLTCLLATLALCLNASALPLPPALVFQEAPAQGSVKRLIGAIKAISGNTVTVSPDSGAEVSVTVDASTHMRRIAPGEKDLKNATAVQLTDLQVGDRILVGGKASDDGKSLAASSIIVMKRSDVEAKQEQERQDWQKRGMGGLVSAVDPSSGTVTISVTGFGGTKSIAVHTSKSTILRRYAPDSVKFDDAKPSSLQQIKPGDQLRARGDRGADGSELTADEIVTGSFRNVAGVVNSADASTGMISVQDLLTKKPVQIKVSSDSQLHKLPPEMAQRIAMRLKGAAMGGRPGSAGAGGGNSSGAAASGQSAPNAGSPVAGGAAGGMRQGGAPDFNQMLSRMPVISIADLHKGDALLIVATEGSDTRASTAITLVSGVEPILQAAPSAGQAMMLAPWSLGGPSGDAGNQ